MTKQTFEGKVVLITGGSSGIGLATATAYASVGANVAILARTRNNLESAAKHIKETTGRECLVLVADVSDFNQMSQAFELLLNHFGCPDIVINSAGINNPKGTLSSTVDEFEEVVKVNLTGTFITCKLAAQAMVEKGNGGCIINISSVQAMSGGRSPQYSASKAGVHGLSKSLARELAPHGIRVLVLAPGGIETEFAKKYWSKETRSKLEKDTLLGRVGRPEEMASIILFLTSDDASYMVGTVVHANGGYRLD